MAPKLTAEADWREFLTRGNPGLQRLRGWFRRVPQDPRCVSCCVPFEGPVAPFFRALGFRRFDKNPRWCSNCFNHLDKRQRGGAVVEISMLFADVRGSTPMAEAMAPTQFHSLIDRFYAEGTRVLIEHDALIERFMGDQIVGYFVPSFAGTAHARHAIDAGVALLGATGHGDPGGPWIPVGVGVHTGEAFVGTVGDPGQVVNFTALGDAVNLGARLASAAADGELMMSEASASAGTLPADLGERRSVFVKGKQDAVSVRVLTVEASKAIAVSAG
ncbi:MAG: adenylate/guanylate cyclase domain-containing protein [Chloroflexota bacterium]